MTPLVTTEALVEALAEFQRRNGYHRPEIEELLMEFGELVLATATAELARLRAEGEAKDRRIDPAERAKVQLGVAQNALVKIDRGGKPMREIAARALLDIAMVPYPEEAAAFARAAKEEQADA